MWMCYNLLLCMNERLNGCVCLYAMFVMYGYIDILCRVSCNYKLIECGGMAGIDQCPTTDRSLDVFWTYSYDHLISSHLN